MNLYRKNRSYYAYRWKLEPVARLPPEQKLNYSSYIVKDVRHWKRRSLEDLLQNRCFPYRSESNQIFARLRLLAVKLI